MTSYTRYYGLPHPTATVQADGSERFNDDARGGRDLQSLAEAVDRQIDRVGALWVTEISKPATICRLAADVTGVPASSDFGWDTDTNVKTSGGYTNNTQFTFGSDQVPGWYHVEMSLASIPSGASTGVRRLAKMWVQESQASGIVTVEEYLNEEFEAGGQTVNHLSFVTYLDGSRSIQLVFFHNNPSSTLTIKAGVTYCSAYRITTRT